MIKSCVKSSMSLLPFVLKLMVYEIMFHLEYIVISSEDIEDYIKFYNEIRFQTNLKGSTPINFRNQALVN